MFPLLWLESFQLGGGGPNIIEIPSYKLVFSQGRELIGPLVISPERVGIMEIDLAHVGEEDSLPVVIFLLGWIMHIMLFLPS